MDSIIKTSEEQIDLEFSEYEKDPSFNPGMDFDLYSPFRVDSVNKAPSEQDSFLQRVDSLPTSIKNLVTNIDTVEKIISYVEDFDLDEEQTSSLSKIVQKVSLGEIPITRLAVVINGDLGIDRAQELAEKMVRDLFATTIEDIKKIQHEKFPDRMSGSQGSVPKPSNQTLTPPAPPGINQNNVVDLRNKQ